MRRVLIANRGEIAVRVARACQAQGLEAVAIYSDADATALHVRVADRAVRVGEAAPTASYLDVDAVLAAADEVGADAIHPGYGFLSENAAFARRVAASGRTWVGPPPEAIERMGDKIAARAAMEAAGVPVVPGKAVLTGPEAAGEDGAASLEALVAAAEEVGYPVLVKASAGGGGHGMRAVHRPQDLRAAIEGARREALSAFGDGTVYIERLLERARHVEIQIFGDVHGGAVHLMERECSIQRRHQKILEESPSPVMTPELRDAMGAAAVAAARAVGYVGAGTVEFLLDEDGHFYFLEMNTRLQVEHPVTELVLGVDLVRAQLAVARGEPLPWRQEDLRPRGHAIEVRLYAEDPRTGFLPSTGPLLRYRPPSGPGVRLDSGFEEGDEVSMHYDPMLAKLICWGEDRAQAIARLDRALAAWQVHGVATNLGFARAVLAHPDFVRGATHTRFVDEHLEALLDALEPACDDALVALAVAQALGAGRGDGGHPAGGRAGRGGGDWVSPWGALGPWRSLS